jgi:chromatin modification-related protein EAF6
MSMPSALVTEVSRRRSELRSELTQIEKQIYDLEGSYLEETRDFGNVFTGWNNYLSYEKTKAKKITNDERLFSLSSMTSPAGKKADAAKPPPAK